MYMYILVILKHCFNIFSVILKIKCICEVTRAFIIEIVNIIIFSSYKMELPMNVLL